MNERIRQLLAQCQQESIDGPEYPHWTDQAKFAELIVRECLGIYDKIENGNRHLGTDRYPAAVGRHFGLIGRPTVDKTTD